ncbi:MAG: SIS domain-containing protein [Marivibrio sp.]|uniref:SIS domain-containing protein n=1 Tax=Marivibrio sp. TaxID=2039719 RepID=UPI0032ED9F08
MGDRTAFFTRCFDEHADVLAATRAGCAADLDAMAGAWLATIQGGGKILFFGNGGSAGDAQHLATELTVRFKADRAPIAALALTTDSSTLTAIGNDYGFERLFARQIEALAKPEDLALGISTSGESPNVLAGIAAARRVGARTAAFSGCGGGALAEAADLCITVPSDVTARIQEMHILAGQMLCAALEIDLGLAPD